MFSLVLKKTKNRKEENGMRWEDVLRRDDIVGGDLETQENGVVYRGPISKVELKDGTVFFESPWIGILGEDGGWRKGVFNCCSINAAISPPRDIGDGRIQFNMPGLGLGVIFPKGGSKLDPAKVEGLRLE